jgi:aspartate-semialdehyde dehydrogenase
MKITATTVRVPVSIGHAEAINVEFERELTPEAARDVLSQADGVVVVDGPTDDPLAKVLRKVDPEDATKEPRDAPELQYPTQRDVLRDEWKDMVLVGRIRRDDTVQHGLNLWVVSDNLRKGAATNVVQIAEKLILRGRFGEEARAALIRNRPELAS